MQQAIARIVMRELSDPRIDTARTSITRVQVQEDLLRAKVYVSIYGTDAQQRLGLEALQHAAGRIQSLMRHDISLRSTPVLDFRTDEQFKGALKTYEIIRQAMDELKAKEEQAKPPEEQEPTEAKSDQPEQDQSESDQPDSKEE